MAIFRGSFSFLRYGSFLHFGGKIVRSPRVFFSLGTLSCKGKSSHIQIIYLIICCIYNLLFFFFMFYSNLLNQSFFSSVSVFLFSFFYNGKQFHIEIIICSDYISFLSYSEESLFIFSNIIFLFFFLLSFFLLFFFFLSLEAKCKDEP